MENWNCYQIQDVVYSVIFSDKCVFKQNKDGAGVDNKTFVFFKTLP